MGAVVPRPSIPRRRAQAWALQAEIELDDALLGRVPADKRFEDVLRRYARDISPGKRGARPESLRIDALCRNELAKVALRSLSASDFAHFAKCLLCAQGGGFRQQAGLMTSAMMNAKTATLTVFKRFAIRLKSL